MLREKQAGWERERVCVREKQENIKTQNNPDSQELQIHIWILSEFQRIESPNTNDLYIHYIDKSIDTPFFRTEKCTSKSVATTMKT